MLLRRWFRIEDRELAPVLWAFAYFYFLLSAYYLLRPVRDEMGVRAGLGQLPWLFSATFVAMLLVTPLFGWAATRLPSRRLVPAVYGFFIVNILLFYLAMDRQIAPAWVAGSYFVWLSVFNLFVVSVFWSVMADLFRPDQSRRVFGLIAAGGSAGAITGPGLAAWLVGRVQPDGLLPLAALLMLLALVCALRLFTWRSRQSGSTPVQQQGLGGGILEGIRLLAGSRYLLWIGVFIWCYTSLATFLYFEQAAVVKASFADSAERTQAFALIDLVVNSLTILLQLFVTARLATRLGLSVTLALLPALMLVGFTLLAMFPVFAVLAAVQVVRRAGNYAVTKPGREMLFTLVSQREKYKAKNVIDTLVYRGGDAVSGWLFAGLGALGLGTAGIAWVGVALAALWTLVGLRLGRMGEARAAAYTRDEQ